jgi:hypothetical protein
MKIKYVGDSRIDTEHGRLENGMILILDDMHGNHLLKMETKNGQKMFVLVEEIKELKDVKEDKEDVKENKSKKIKMVVKESDGL